MASFAEAFQSQSPTLVHRLSEWVKTRGDAPCLHYGENDLALSYREFDQLSDQLASALTAKGLEAGSKLLVYTDNALLSAVAMFAAWKLSAIYCPVNSSLPEEMLRFMLDDLAAQLILCSPHSYNSIAVAERSGCRLGQVVICTDIRFLRPDDNHQEPLLDSMPAGAAVLDDLTTDLPAFSALTPSAQTLSSVIYTSGTTSHPKGVVHSHAWQHALCATQSVWTHPDDVIHCDLPMYHIGGAFSLFARGIWSGSSVVLWDRFSTRDYWYRINRFGSSIALMLDVMTDYLLDTAPSADDLQNSLAKVHLQPLSARHGDLAKRFGIDFVLTGYGSTEVGNALMGCIDELGAGDGTPAALWRGYSKTELKARVVDHLGAEALLNGAEYIAPGMMGLPSGAYRLDLEGAPIEPADHPSRIKLTPLVSGGLFLGYHNAPSSDEPKDYLAPDFAVRDDAGRYCFADRQEGFYRVKGENVSALALEQKFLQHDLIRQCAVVGLPALQGEENDLVLFVQPVEGEVIDADEVLAWGREHLPKYMQPGWCRVSESLPLTSTLKIDRGALKQAALKLQRTQTSL